MSEIEFKRPEVGPNADAITALTRGRGPRRGNLEDLLKYWRPIMKKPGGFRRCVATLIKHPKFGGRPQRICAWLHHELTGKWPNEGNHHGRRGKRRGKRRSSVRRAVRRAAKMDSQHELMSFKTVARESREFHGVLVQPIAGRQEAVNFKAAMFMKSQYGQEIRVKKVGAFAAGSRTGEYLQGAGSYILPGDFSDFRSPVRSRIYATLTPGSFRLRRPDLGLPNRRNRRRGTGGGARNKFRCPPGFEKGGTFTNANFSTCGAQILGIPNIGPGAISTDGPDGGAQRQLADLAERANLVRTIGNLNQNRSAYDIIRAAQIPVAPKKGSPTRRQTAVDLILARIDAEEFTSRVVRRDGVILENVVPFERLSAMNEFDDMVDGSLIERYRGGQVGVSSAQTLTTGLRDVYVAIPGVGSVRVSRVGGELTPADLADLRRKLPAIARRNTSSPDPSAAIREFVTQSDGRYTLEFGGLQNNRFTVNESKNELITVAASGSAPIIVPQWVYETFLSRTAPRRDKASPVYEVVDEKQETVFSIQGKSLTTKEVPDFTYFKTVRERAHYAANLFDVVEIDEKIRLRRTARRVGRTIGDTGQAVGGRGARAIFDNNIGRYRCPPGTRYGGRITDQFGRNCGYSLPRRIVNRIVDAAQAVEYAFENRNRDRVPDANVVELDPVFEDELQEATNAVDSVMRSIDNILEEVDAPNSGTLGRTIAEGGRDTTDAASAIRDSSRPWAAALQKLRELVNNDEFEKADIEQVRNVFQRLERAAGVEAGRQTVAPPRSPQERSGTARIMEAIEDLARRILAIPAVSRSDRRDTRNRRDRSPDAAPRPRDRRRVDIPTGGAPIGQENPELERLRERYRGLADEVAADLNNGGGNGPSDPFLDIIDEFQFRGEEYNKRYGGRTMDFFNTLSDDEVNYYLHAFEGVENPESGHLMIADRLREEAARRREVQVENTVNELDSRASAFDLTYGGLTERFFNELDDNELEKYLNALRDRRDENKLESDLEQLIGRLEEEYNARGLNDGIDARDPLDINIGRYAWGGRFRRNRVTDLDDLNEIQLANVVIQMQNEFDDLSREWMKVLDKDDINDFDHMDMRAYIGSLKGELGTTETRRLWRRRYNDWLELNEAIRRIQNEENEDEARAAIQEHVSRLSRNRKEAIVAARNADGEVPRARGAVTATPEEENLAQVVLDQINDRERFQRDIPLQDRPEDAIQTNADLLQQVLRDGNFDDPGPIRRELDALVAELWRRDEVQRNAGNAAANVPAPPAAQSLSQRVAKFDWRGRSQKKIAQRQRAIDKLAQDRYGDDRPFVPTWTTPEGEVLEGKEAFARMRPDQKKAFLRQAFSDGVEMDAGYQTIDGVVYRKTITPKITSVTARENGGGVSGDMIMKVYRVNPDGSETLLKSEQRSEAWPAAGFTRSFNFSRGYVKHDTLGLKTFYDPDSNSFKTLGYGDEPSPSWVDFRGGGFATEFNNNAFLFYRGMGLERVTLSSAQDGKAVWTGQGFRDTNPDAIRSLNGRDGMQRLVNAYDGYLEAIRQGRKPTQTELLARMVVGNDPVAAERVRRMLNDAANTNDPNNMPGHHDYLIALLPDTDSGDLGRNQAAFNLFRDGLPLAGMSDDELARHREQIRAEMPAGVSLQNEDFDIPAAAKSGVAPSRLLGGGEYDLTKLEVPDNRVAQAGADLALVQERAPNYQRFLAPNNPGAGVYEAVPIGANGMDVSADAVRHIDQGGALADVPDEFLKDAILKNSSPRDGEKRFKLMGRSDDGVNGLTIYYDQKEDRLIGIKFAEGAALGQEEGHNEILGAALGERLGLAQGQVRFDGWTARDPARAGRNQPWQTRTIVVDLAQNYTEHVRIGNAYKVARDLYKTRSLSRMPDAEARVRMGIMDLISGNQDRHGNNFMYAQDRNGDWRLIPIDNGLGFFGGAYGTNGFFAYEDDPAKRMAGWARGFTNRDEGIKAVARNARNRDKMLEYITKAQQTMRENEALRGGWSAELEGAIGVYSPEDAAGARRTVSRLLENYEWILNASPEEILALWQRA